MKSVTYVYRFRATVTTLCDTFERRKAVLGAAVRLCLPCRANDMLVTPHHFGACRSFWWHDIAAAGAGTTGALLGVENALHSYEGSPDGGQVSKLRLAFVHTAVSGAKEASKLV